MTNEKKSWNNIKTNIGAIINGIIKYKIKWILKITSKINIVPRLTIEI